MYLKDKCGNLLLKLRCLSALLSLGIFLELWIKTMYFCFRYENKWWTIKFLSSQTRPWTSFFLVFANMSDEEHCLKCNDLLIILYAVKQQCEKWMIYQHNFRRVTSLPAKTFYQNRLSGLAIHIVIQIYFRTFARYIHHFRPNMKTNNRTRVCSSMSESFHCKEYSLALLDSSPYISIPRKCLSLNCEIFNNFP